jgi:hypothetical protein
MTGVVSRQTGVYHPAVATLTLLIMNPSHPFSDKQPHPEEPPAGPAGQAACPIPLPPDVSGITSVALKLEPPVANYLEALRLAEAAAKARLHDYMLLSWYDRDRDFEAPQHVSECHQGGAVPGYVDYGIHHGATLKVDVEDGRFVFFYRPVEL